MFANPERRHHNNQFNEALRHLNKLYSQKCSAFNVEHKEN